MLLRRWYGVMFGGLLIVLGMLAWGDSGNTPILAQMGATPTADAANDEEAAEGVVAEEDGLRARAVLPLLDADGDPWARIQATGRLVVGVSADYPPFEYYNENFRIDGFDPALIRAVAKELGVEAQILDIAFEGLPAALRLGQIDVAISAMDVTPERLNELGFTQAYFVSEDAVIAVAGRELEPITTLEQMAGYRIGVQEGTIYASLVTRELIETGLMPAANLFTYRNFGSVLNDLVQERLDLVMLDAIPADRLVRLGSVQIVGRGLNSQNYAIATAPGAVTLVNELDQALDTLREEGVLAQLVADYLLIAPPNQAPLPTQPPPVELPLLQTGPVATPTPVPTAVPTVTPTPDVPTCVDGMQWVADLNFDDQMMRNPPVLTPGTPFQKGWRIQNTGTCTWGPSYRLDFVQGNVDAARMGGVFRAIIGNVAPGEMYNIYVDLIAPVAPGTYQGIWQMQDGSGAAFGERIWVGIVVPAPPTPTPVATATPSDQIDFRADRTRITAGERVVFSWRVENVAAVYFYAQGQRWEDHGVGGVDRREVYPNQSTTYELRVVGRDGQTRVSQIRIEVGASANAPRLSRFTVDPPGSVGLGGCYTLQWEVEGAVNRVRITVNDSTAWDYAPVRGNWSHCPGTAGTYQYAVIADSGAGTVRGGETRLVQGQAPPPTPQPPQQDPIIYGFTVQPSQIRSGECVSVAWSTGAGVQYVRLLRNGAVILDSGPVAGNIQDCIGTPGLVNYRLEARNNTGGLATGQSGVNVAGP